jgi:hypothetical protein
MFAVLGFSIIKSICFEQQKKGDFPKNQENRLLVKVYKST